MTGWLVDELDTDRLFGLYTFNTPDYAYDLTVTRDEQGFVRCPVCQNDQCEHVQAVASGFCDEQRHVYTKVAHLAGWNKTPSHWCGQCYYCEALQCEV